MSLSIGSPGTGPGPRPGPPPGPGRSRGSGGRPAKKTSRRTTQVRRNALVMAWLLTAAVLAGLTIVGPLVSWGTWLPLHALLLGGIGSAITIWSAHFADTLLHRPALGGAALLDARLYAHSLGTAVVLTGITMGHQVLALIGAGIVMAQAIAGVVAITVQYRRAIAPRLASLAVHYAVALVLLATGALLGFLISWSNARGRSGLADIFYLAHTTTMLLGFVGTTVLGTLTVLWPTMLRTPMEPVAPRWTTRGLPYLVGGTALVAASGLWLPLAGLGTVVYLGGACGVLVPAYRTARRVPPTSFATASATASVSWFVGCVAALGARMALADDATAARDVVHALRLPLAAGFALQILVAALSYLAPVMLGGGPAATRATNTIMDRHAAYRVTAANACLLLAITPTMPWQVRLVAGALAALVTSYLLVGVILCLRELSRRKHTPRTPAGAAPTLDPAGRQPAQPRRGTR